MSRQAPTRRSISATSAVVSVRLRVASLHRGVNRHLSRFTPRRTSTLRGRKTYIARWFRLGVETNALD